MLLMNQPTAANVSIQTMAATMEQQISTSSDPIPTPRMFNTQPKANTNGELHIQTQSAAANQHILMNQRIRDLSNEVYHQQQQQQQQFSSSAQSTPTNSCSLMSESSVSSTTTNALLSQLNDMNSAALIPKLIERLDRKLVVMKGEQLALLREIEMNETAGARLFDELRHRLTAQEFDKIHVHASEIEKVTKLILSLRMRLKRVESELKERQAASSSGNSSTGTTPEPADVEQLEFEQATERQETTTSKQLVASHHQLAPQTSQTKQQRGLSDPTSTVGLPKRNHQHHNSLNTATTPPTTATSTTSTTTTNQEETNQKKADDDDQVAKSTTSSDSIFNCADSALGGSCTITSCSSSSAHGGSSNHVDTGDAADMRGGESSPAQTATSSSSSSRHMSSNMSVSSSNISGSSSVPSSPSLMSPTSTSGSCSLQANKKPATPTTTTTTTNTPTTDSNNNPKSQQQQQQQQQQNLLDNSLSGNIAAANCSQLSDSLLMNLITDLDILQAKRNKLIAQLEEAHQLEQCIVKRNSIIVERILKKYYGQQQQQQQGDEEVEEIAAFKQFTKLKSLLLKDSHDIADRIDNAELQLSELKQQTNPSGLP